MPVTASVQTTDFHSIRYWFDPSAAPLNCTSIMKGVWVFQRSYISKSGYFHQFLLGRATTYLSICSTLCKYYGFWRFGLDFFLYIPVFQWRNRWHCLALDKGSSWRYCADRCRSRWALWSCRWDCFLFFFVVQNFQRSVGSLFVPSLLAQACQLCKVCHVWSLRKHAVLGLSFRLFCASFLANFGLEKR